VQPQNRVPDTSRKQTDRQFPLLKSRRGSTTTRPVRPQQLNALSPIPTPHPHPASSLTANFLFRNPRATPVQHPGRATYTHPPCATWASTCPHDRMTITLDRPPNVDLRPPRAPTRDPGAAIMEMVPMDDNPRTLPQYSGPAPPPMHRIPPPDTPHGLPAAPGLYDQSWRQYPPPYEGHPSEPRRTSNGPPQPPLGSHNYPPMHSRELPQISPDGPYTRPASLPTPAHAPVEPPQPPANYHPMNGVPHESPPLSAPPDFTRARMSFPPQEAPLHTNGEPPMPSNSLPPSQYPTAVPPPSHTPGPYDSSYYQSQSFNMRHRKATRAQQVG
jgi:hypothetical protein